MDWNYEKAGCSLRKDFIMSFIIIFGTLSFPIGQDNGHADGMWQRTYEIYDRLFIYVV